jgi:hypothetical protein
LKERAAPAIRIRPVAVVAQGSVGQATSTTIRLRVANRRASTSSLGGVESAALSMPVVPVPGEATISDTGAAGLVTAHSHEAGLWSVLPAASVARTSKV